MVLLTLLPPVPASSPLCLAAPGLPAFPLLCVPPTMDHGVFWGPGLSEADPWAPAACCAADLWLICAFSGYGRTGEQNPQIDGFAAHL